MKPPTGEGTDGNGLWSETLRAVADYWRGKKRDRAMPSRADIDPVELRLLLPNIYLLDVLGPSRYRYRLIGTMIAERLKADATGRDVDDKLFGENAPAIVQMYDHVANHGSPVLNNARLFWTEVNWLNYTSVILPLSNDGVNVNMMLGAMDFWLTERPTLQPAAFRLVDWRPLALP
ncbi:MAG: PAS domain-containing protein [Dongiaceae bacterium]